MSERAAPYPNLVRVGCCSAVKSQSDFNGAASHLRQKLKKDSLISDCLISLLLFTVYHFCIHIADLTYVTIGYNLAFGKNNCLVAQLSYSVGTV